MQLMLRKDRKKISGQDFSKIKWPKEKYFHRTKLYNYNLFSFVSALVHVSASCQLQCTLKVSRVQLLTSWTFPNHFVDPSSPRRTVLSSCACVRIMSAIVHSKSIPCLAINQLDLSKMVYGPILLTHRVLDVQYMLINPFPTTFTLYRTICFAVTLNTSYT